MLGPLPRLLVVVATLGGMACSSDGEGGGGTPVTATLSDSSLALSPPSATAGQVTFQARNDGTQTHELYVFATDLPVDQLPVADGTVDEDAEGVTFMAEAEDIAPGTSKDLGVEIAAGNYVLLCNIPGHYEAGIRAAFDAT